MSEVIKPSQVDAHVGLFDRFAERASKVVSRAPFFAFCVLLVLIWAPTMAFMPIDSSQLIINTSTTIITFLMVALLENSSTRSDMAVQHKLNAVADALADFMEHVVAETTDPYAKAHLQRDVAELKAAVGLEQRESS